MAKSFSGLGAYLNMLCGSKSNHEITGCRKDHSDPNRYYIMEASGNERPESEGKPIDTIMNGGDRSTIVFMDGSKLQVLHDTGCKRVI